MGGDLKTGKKEPIIKVNQFKSFVFKMKWNFFLNKKKEEWIKGVLIPRILFLEKKSLEKEKFFLWKILYSNLFFKYDY